MAPFEAWVMQDGRVNSEEDYYRVDEYDEQVNIVTPEGEIKVELEKPRFLKKDLEKRMKVEYPDDLDLVVETEYLRCGSNPILEGKIIFPAVDGNTKGEVVVRTVSWDEKSE